MKKSIILCLITILIAGVALFLKVGLPYITNEASLNSEADLTSSQDKVNTDIDASLNVSSNEKEDLGVDNVPPTLAYTVISEGWQGEFVEIEIVSKDELSGVRCVTLNNEEITLENSKSRVKLYENREYILYAEDVAGNSTSKSITINTIDKTAPKILGATASEFESDDKIKLLVQAKDIDSGIAGIIVKDIDKVSANDIGWKNFKSNPTSKQFATFEIEKNKTYYCFAKDKVGNISKYEEEIEFDFIDKTAPIIEDVKITLEEEKEYVIGNAVVVEIKASDNVAVDEVLISNEDMPNEEAMASNNWQKYNEKLVYKLPVEGDKIYTLHIWVKDQMGNIGIKQTVNVELKALIVGDNELDYIGSDRVYNKTSLRFLVKDFNFDFDNSLTEECIMVRLTSGDKVLENINTGLSLKKISDYDGKEVSDFEYTGEVYELDMENLYGTGMLNVVLIEGKYEDLARNKGNAEIRKTDIFVDNNTPNIEIKNTGRFADEIEIREIRVKDEEGHLINLLEVEYDGDRKTYTLTNGRVEIPIPDGAVVTAYDIAGNEGRKKVGATEKQKLVVQEEVKLKYGEEIKKIKYECEENSIIEVLSSDTNILNVSLDTNAKEIILLPVNAGSAEITLRALKTDTHLENKVTIKVEVTPLPVVLSWTNEAYTYNGKGQKVEATVQNAILGDKVLVCGYKNNNKLDAGTYKAEATELTNSNYTVVGGENITHDWQINKANRSITLNKEKLELEVSRTGKLTFEYTGENSKAEVVSSNEKVMIAEISNYNNSGEVKITPVDLGKSEITIKVKETKNFNELRKVIPEENMEVILKVWVAYDEESRTSALGKWAVYGKNYPELEIPKESGKRFVGWYTEPDGKGTLINTDTVVTSKEEHIVYPCFNNNPEFNLVKVANEEKNSLTFYLDATDLDKENVRYRIYVNGDLKHTSDYVPQNTIYTYTLKRLKEDTYTYYIVVDDGVEETKTETKVIR